MPAGSVSPQRALTVVVWLGISTNLLAQAEALELARRGTGELRDEEDPARALVCGQLGPGDSAQITGGATKASGLMRPCSSAAPTTPASATAGWADSARSTSAGATHIPATLKRSSSRPRW